MDIIINAIEILKKSSAVKYPIIKKKNDPHKLTVAFFLFSQNFGSLIGLGNEVIGTSAAYSNNLYSFLAIMPQKISIHRDNTTALPFHTMLDKSSDIPTISRILATPITILDTKRRVLFSFKVETDDSSFLIMSLIVLRFNVFCLLCLYHIIN